jgi:hypothetical protein
MFYNIVDALPFSFPFPPPPEFHREDPLLQMFYIWFVYDHDCFSVYVYLLDLSSMYERKHVAFVFLSLAGQFGLH